MANPDLGIDDLSICIDQVDEKMLLQTSDSIAGVGRMLGAKGKRWRPLLVMAVAHHSGKLIDDEVIRAAAAVELIHLASLVHDDIMDGGVLRHGIPTISAKEGTDSAILAGDYMIAKGISLAASVSAEVASVLAETTAYLCEGQAIEMADQFNLERTIESLQAAIRGKTSSLFQASCRLGGLVAGMDQRRLDVLSGFAEDFGIYYQYMDDIRDFTESPESSGKSVGGDIREGNYTLPVLLSLRGQHSRELKEILQASDVSVSRARQVLDKDGSLGRARAAAEEYKQAALQTLSRLDNAGLARALGTFLI